MDLLNPRLSPDQHDRSNTDTHYACMFPDATCLINAYYIKNNKMQRKYLVNIIYIWKKYIFTCDNMKYTKRLYFTCKNIAYNLITSVFTVDFPQPTSDFQTPFSYKRSKAQNVGIHWLNWIARGLLVIKLSIYAEFSTFFTPAPRTAVSDLEDYTGLH